MIFRMDQGSGEITEITSEEARRALETYKWSKRIVGEFFMSAKVLFTPNAYFCRFKGRLEELRSEVAR